MKMRFFCRIYPVQNIGEDKLYLTALPKLPTQTVDSSQYLAMCIRQKQPQIIKSITKNWDKNKIKNLERVCPKQDHNLLSTF